MTDQCLWDIWNHDLIDTFRNNTPAVNQEFIRKVKLTQVPVTGSHTRKIDTSIVFFFSRRLFAAQCLKICIKNTEARRNFTTHSDLSVKIKDKSSTSKVLRDIWTLSGYMIDTFKNTAPDVVYQKVVPKKWIETSPFHGV